MSADASQLSQLLVRAANVTDDRAYERVIEIAMQRLVILVRRMLRGYPRLRRWEETDDVFQEAVLRLNKSLRAVSPVSTADFFGLAVLQIHRTLIDLTRQHFGPQGAQGRLQSDPLLFANDARKRSLADFTGEPQSLAEWTEFHEAVTGLPDDERAVFAAVYYGGANYAEAAELLGVTRRTAIRRMNRARLRLARFLDVDIPVAAE